MYACMHVANTDDNLTILNVKVFMHMQHTQVYLSILTEGVVPRPYPGHHRATGLNCSQPHISSLE